MKIETVWTGIVIKLAFLLIRIEKNSTPYPHFGKLKSMSVAFSIIDQYNNYVTLQNMILMKS